MALTVIGASPRTPVLISVDRAVGVTAEALSTLAISKALAAASTATSYTVTTGKTLRLQALAATILDSSTTAVYGRVRVRAVPTGGTLSATTSPIVVTLDLGNYPGTAAAGLGSVETLSFPDGIELPGGSIIGLSHIESATTATVSISLVGYEY